MRTWRQGKSGSGFAACIDGEYDAAAWEAVRREGEVPIFCWAIYQKGINPDGSDGCVGIGEADSLEDAKAAAAAKLDELWKAAQDASK